MSFPQEWVEKFEYPAMPFTPVELSVQGLTEVVAPDTRSLQVAYSDHRDHSQETGVDLEEEKQRAFAAGRESGVMEEKMWDSNAASCVARVNRSVSGTSRSHKSPRIQRGVSESFTSAS